MDLDLDWGDADSISKNSDSKISSPAPRAVRDSEQRQPSWRRKTKLAARIAQRVPSPAAVSSRGSSSSGPSTSASSDRGSSICLSPSSRPPALSSKASKSNVITYGSDCSGMGTDSVALRRAALPGQLLKNKFACEKSAVARRVLRRGKCPPDVLYRDLTSPKRLRQSTVDFYTAGPPCQPYSAAGKNKGAADSRCMLTRVVGYIQSKQPKLFVIENVKNLLAQKHRFKWEQTLLALKNIKCPAGKKVYDVQFKVLNSKHFGLAQHRPRIYLVGCSRSVATRKFQWPALTLAPSLGSFLDNNRSAVEQKLAVERKLSATNLRNINTAVKQVKDAGMDPRSVNISVDIGCGVSRFNMMHNLCPAITKTRAASRDFWRMSAARRLTMNELLRLQGLAAQDVDLDGLSERQVGEMVGNAMSVPVLSAVLQEGLSVCGMR